MKGNSMPPHPTTRQTHSVPGPRRGKASNTKDEDKDTSLLDEDSCFLAEVEERRRLLGKCMCENILTQSLHYS